MKLNPHNKIAGANAEAGLAKTNAAGWCFAREKARSTMETIVAEQPFLSRLPPEFYHSFAQCASLKYLADGEKLFCEGGTADCFYLIRSGRIALTTSAQDGSVTVQVLKPGEAVGWSWLMPPFKWPFAALAVGPVDLLVFDARCLRKCGKENSHLYNELVSRIVQCLIYGNGQQTSPSIPDRQTPSTNHK